MKNMNRNADNCGVFKIRLLEQIIRKAQSLRANRKTIVALALIAFSALSVWAATCMACGGSGMLTCSQCGGRAMVTVMVPGPMGPYPNTIPCPGCAQRGLPAVIRCNRCSGTGQVYLPSFGGTVYKCVSHPGCSFNSLNGHFDRYGKCLSCGCSMAHHK